MELNLTADQATLWQQLMNFTNEKLMALAADVETTGTIDQTVLKTLMQRGLPRTGLVPTHSGISQQTVSLLAVSQSSAGIAAMLAAWWQVADQLLVYGTAQQKRTYLADPQLMGLPALGANGNPITPVTAEPAQAQTSWELTGELRNVINGGTATTYLVLATDTTAGPTTYLVAADHAGISKDRDVQSAGLRGLHVVDLRFERVTVTDADRLGAPGQGLAIMQRAQNLGRLFVSAITAGTLEHASQQVRQLALGEQEPLVQLTPILATVRSIATAALDAAQQADSTGEFGSAVPLTAWLAAQNGTFQLAPITQLIGELGYTAQSPLMALQRDLQTLPLLGGTLSELATAVATSMAAGSFPEKHAAKQHLEPERLAVSDLHRVVKNFNLTKDVPVNVGPIATAKRVIALGRGALDPAILMQARQLAKWIGAAIAVTQPLTMLEQFSVDQEIGADAVKVAPNVLINIGISGDEQYLAGITDAKHVLSVNQDSTAPVMAVSQQVFVGTTADFLDGMVAALN